MYVSLPTGRVAPILVSAFPATARAQEGVSVLGNVEGVQFTAGATSMYG